MRNTKSLSSEAANLLMSSDTWSDLTCAICNASLEHGMGQRPTGGPDNIEPDRYDLVCHDCIYSYDTAEFRRSGVLSGSMMSTTAMLRQDFVTFKPFFDAEVKMVPTIQAIWAKYKDHPTLNDPNTKRGILIHCKTGFTYSRTWGEEFTDVFKGQLIALRGDIVIEIFDSMCGYVGIEIYRFGRADGMWVQGQIRESGGDAWYRSCYANMAFLDEVNAAIRSLVKLPVGYTLYEYGVRLPQGLFGVIHCFGDEELGKAADKAWEHAETNVRAFLCRTYNIPEFQPELRLLAHDGSRDQAVPRARERSSRDSRSRAGTHIT